MMRAFGVFLALGSFLLFPQILTFFQRAPLVVAYEAKDISPGPHFDIRGQNIENILVDGERGILDTPLTPGLHYGQWSTHYRGGKTRSVGHSQLVGPFQDPAAPPCSTFLLIGQSFLDDSSGGKAASENTLVHVIGKQVRSELRGIDMWPLGEFESMSRLSLRWIRWESDKKQKPWQQRLSIIQGGAAPQGHLEVEFTAEFENGKVPLSLKLTPIIEDESLRFELSVRAKLDLDNRLYQWVANRFDGNDRVSKLIKGQIRSQLRYLLDKPPPIPLGNGAFLPLEFCRDTQITFSPNGYVAVPLAIGVTDKLPAPPLRKHSGKPSDLPMKTGLAVEIDENGLNAILHALWSSSMLDKHLANSLVRSFNEQETVKNFLSIRLREAFFHLPPTITLDSEFILRATASAVIEDQETQTDARLFTQINFGLDILEPASGTSNALGLRTMELSCLQGAGVLQSCYAGLMSQVRANQAPLQDLLTNSFTQLLTKLLTKREISDSQTKGRYLLDHVSFSSRQGHLRAHLHGQVEAE
ncbi:MAG: hypothetical protein JKY56_21610 [Kofleriaceae bacterium]|nr:hypothetical protein [Kofleriaceae bacterium]